MAHRANYVGLMIGAVVLATSCASPPVEVQDVPESSAKIAALLVGRWYEGDLVLPRAAESYRFELTFAADGTCAYYFVPAVETRPARVTRGTWRLDGRMLLFEWESHTVRSHPVVESGRIIDLDRRHLTIQRSGSYDTSVQSFYRKYRDSVSRLQRA